MKTFLTNRESSLRSGAALLLVLLCALAATPWLPRAQAMAFSITVVNNSSREMRHLYLSPIDSDDWGPDQLNDSTVTGSGGSFTIADVSLPGSQIKVIAEDMDGCFVSGLVSRADEAVWTITNDAVPNCGNN
jgi:hypothetical protein